jgi:hypothetical protein
MDRRYFLTALGLSATGVSGLQGQLAGPSVSTLTHRIDLNGIWERHDRGLVDAVEVPSSLRPSGAYRLVRSFVLSDAPKSRFILHFEAITYYARVSVNGRLMGVMDPYVPYDFDITPHVREGKNELDVEIADLHAASDGGGMDAIAVGLNPGWEGYGGIIRDVWIDVRPQAFVNGLLLGYELAEDFSLARCSLRVQLDSTIDSEGQVAVSLTYRSAEVASFRDRVRLRAGQPAELRGRLDVETPALWSPDRPNLYELKVELETDAGKHVWASRTGFRQFQARGRHLELNGERFIVNGLCRHDLWHNQGFTLSRSQMEQDLRMIKAMGANFVRLAHYPHHRHIVELADEIGLGVSGEPGYWQVDFAKIPRGQIELGLRTMRKLIERDAISPSVLFWLVSNESAMTEPYLREAHAVCLAADPLRRPVSFANNQQASVVKPLFEATEMAFFSSHPYTHDLRRFRQLAEEYGESRPLIFTEWGGKVIGQTEIPMQETVDELVRLVDEGLLAGHVFWSWQDLPEFSRDDLEMEHGILQSGVTTEAREVRPFVQAELSRLFERRLQDPATPAVPAAIAPRNLSAPAAAALLPLDLQALAASGPGQAGWDALQQEMKAHWGEGNNLPFVDDQWTRMGGRFSLWPQDELLTGGIPFRPPEDEQGCARLLVVNEKAPELRIPVARRCRRIYLLGHVTMPEGFPIQGGNGETVATYHVEKANGQSTEIPLRQGFEVARANTVHVATRIDPTAVFAPRALWYLRDQARERYQFLLYTLDASDDYVERITCRHAAGQPSFCLLAATVELAPTA